MPTYFLKVERAEDNAVTGAPPFTIEAKLQSDELEAAQDEATLLLRDDTSWARDKEEWGRDAGPIAKIFDADGNVVSTRPVEAFNDSWVPVGAA